MEIPVGLRKYEENLAQICREADEMIALVQLETISSKAHLKGWIIRYLKYESKSSKYWDNVRMLIKLCRTSLATKNWEPVKCFLDNTLAIKNK